MTSMCTGGCPPGCPLHHVPHLTDAPCDCPDALAFRALMASPAGEAAEALARSLAVQMLREMSQDLASGFDASSVRQPYLTRMLREAHYDTPGLTPDEIKEAAYRSWGIAP